MVVEHVIFDCDGVLVDSEWLACIAESEVFTDLGVEVSPEYVRDNYVGMANVTMFAQFEADFGLPLPSDFETRHHAKTMELFAKKLEAIPGVEHVLDGLDTLKSVASNSGSERVKSSLGFAGLDRHFGRHVYSADMVAQPKPATDLFEYVLKMTGAAAAGTVVIEDGSSGTLAARTLGMPVLAFVGGSHCTSRTAEKLMDAGARTLFDDMAQLPRLLETL
ncbi:MAG: HAD family phosphatase [Alphaproteobacteria bacterium]|nr:HAD family phosphatase [Alphaproteobacteria bacterium]